MTNKMFFEEVSPGSFVRNPKFGLKNNFCVSEQYKEIDEFCFRIRDNIADLIESNDVFNKQNLYKQEFLLFMVYWRRKMINSSLTIQTKTLVLQPRKNRMLLWSAKGNCMT